MTVTLCKNIFLFCFLDPHLKDGANYNNIQRSLEKTLELESQEDEKNSPFSDLYQMIKKSLDVKTPRKSSASVVQTPSSKFCTPRPGSVAKKSEKGVVFTPKKEEDSKGKTPECVKKRGKSFQVPSAEGPGPRVEEAGKSEGTSQQRRISTPQKFTASEVIKQITASESKSPVRRRSKECTPSKSGVSMEQEEQAGKSPKLENPPKRSPKNSGSAEKGFVPSFIFCISSYKTISGLPQLAFKFMQRFMFFLSENVQKTQERGAWERPAKTKPKKETSFLRRPPQPRVI